MLQTPSQRVTVNGRGQTMLNPYESPETASQAVRSGTPFSITMTTIVSGFVSLVIGYGIGCWHTTATMEEAHQELSQRFIEVQKELIVTRDRLDNALSP